MPHIRPMKADDWEGFQKLDLEVFPRDPVKEGWFVKRTQQPGCFALVQDGEIIGQLFVTRFGADEAHLGRIGVAKAHQGKGYGSMLLDCAVRWFQKEGGIRAAHLYTEDYNEVAQGLYKKYGFKRIGTTWHYFVPYDSVEPKYKYTCHEIKEEEVDSVAKTFPSIPAEVIRRYVAHEKDVFIVLKDKEGSIQGACRFTPSFPGCMPFEITKLECFDDFVAGLKEFKLQEHDYCRVTFTDNQELADLCQERGYRLHHRLHKMELTL